MAKIVRYNGGTRINPLYRYGTKTQKKIKKISGVSIPYIGMEPIAASQLKVSFPVSIPYIGMEPARTRGSAPTSTTYQSLI